MSSGSSMVLNTPTVLLDKEFDPFDHQIVANCTEWDSTNVLTDHIFVATTQDDDDDDEKDDRKHDDTVSLTKTFPGGWRTF